MTIQSYTADHAISPRQMTQAACVLLLVAVGVLVAMVCVLGMVFELDPAGRPSGTGTDLALLAALAACAAVAVAIPTFVARRAFARCDD